MRILMLVHSLRRGGAERVLLEIAHGLQLRGHQVEIVSWLNVDEYSDKEYQSVKRTFLLNIDKYRWPWSVSGSAKELRKIIMEFRPEILEMHTPTVAWLVAWARLKNPALHVLHSYGEITLEGGCRKKCIRGIDRIVAKVIHASFAVVSGPMLPIAARYFRIKEGSISIVHNGVDLSKFKYSPPEFKNKGKLIISMIGTLCANKGQMLGIIAFAELVKTLPCAVLQIAGEGPDNEKLKEMVDKMDLNDKIIFLGRRNNINEVLSITHILWQLSESEAMPMVVLESMATGIPVIGFNVRGVREAVLNGETGMLCNYGDTFSIAKFTVQLIKNNVLYLKYSQNSRKRTEEYFSLESMINSHEIILRKLLNKN